MKSVPRFSNPESTLLFVYAYNTSGRFLIFNFVNSSESKNSSIFELFPSRFNIENSSISFTFTFGASFANIGGITNKSDPWNLFEILDADDSFPDRSIYL